jgi:hypothetical protein
VESEVEDDNRLGEREVAEGEADGVEGLDPK